MWESCEPDAEQAALLEELDTIVRGDDLSRKSSGDNTGAMVGSTATVSLPSEVENDCSVTSWVIVGVGRGKDGDAIHDLLQNVETACKSFIDNLDDMLGALEKVEQAHSDVTGRTNVLMVNCETLLEQQHTLQSVVDQLQEIISPFNDVEEVAGQLGIPVDATGRPYRNRSGNTHSGHSIDPRSAEFRDVLRRISLALKFMGDHPAIRDFNQYFSWLKQLQRRANSLVAKAMLSLLENANKICTTDAARAEYKGGLSGGSSAAKNNADFQNDITSSATPALESMLVYTKFRGLGFRMRELGYMLRCSELSEEGEGNVHIATAAVLDSNKSAYSSDDFLNHINNSRDGSSVAVEMRSARADVLATYKQIRCELLAPIIGNTSLKSRIDGILASVNASNAKRSPRNMNANVGINESKNNPAVVCLDDGAHVSSQVVCSLVRSAFATTFHVAQLEQQLYITLFHTTGTGGGSGAMSVTTGKPTSSSLIERNAMEEQTIREKEEEDPFTEVGDIVKEIASETNGHLRALIIKGSVTVDGLCRVVHTISEDVQSQLNGTRLHPTVYNCLYDSLQRTASDARERLMYCAEAEFRKFVIMFDPLPSQLAYPDILENHSSKPTHGPNTAASRLMTKGGKNSPASTTEVNSGGADSDNSGNSSSQDISRTWYPPLKHTLSLLSLLYGVVDSTVFEDLARRGVTACIDSLIKGASGVRRWKNQLHGDFFLVRHLLILREQLLPFDIDFHTIEKHLDFAPTGSALTSFLSNSRSLLRMDQTNSLLHLAVDGLPGMQESHVDVKKKMDDNLKSSCQALKYSAMHFLLGPLEGFLAKVSAFIGTDIPLYRYESTEYEKNLELEKEQSVLLPSEACENLKNQSFVKPDRIKTMLNKVVETVAESYPNFVAMGQLYVENNMTRDIILKPVHQEMMFSLRRMRTIIASCVNHGQERRDLETLLSSIRVSLKVESI